jgi:nitrite reductase/ring-hydroxylating ferredoxin subunit
MWVPVALSRDVPLGTTRAVILEGEERVVWRAEDGSVQVWEDRCPHRGMRLSLGFVRGNALNCLYHGWTYEAGSRCIRIPAHPDLKVPPSITATAFPVREAGGMIWTEVGEGSGRSAVRGAAPLVTLAVDAPAAAVLAHVGGEQVAGRQLVVATLGGIELNIGWHVAGPGKTMLHTALRTDGDIRTALGIVRRLRTEIEGALAA